MLLSIVMMVKNEEKNLNRSLNYLTPILNQVHSELIILDTGSTDKTVEIAKRYTNKIYFEEWNNNFSEMRNKSISHAKGKWLFILDADEFILESKEIINFFKKELYKKYNTGYISIKSLTKENKYSMSKVARLFKNDKDFKYTGAIHEQPLIKQPIYFLNTDIEHLGYFSLDEELMKRKFYRNVEILEKEIKKDPKNIYYYHQLSQSFHMFNKLDKALEMALKAYEVSKKYDIPLDRSMYVYTHLAFVYFKKEKYNECFNICKEGLLVKDNYIDLYFYLGFSSKKLEKYEEALSSYKRYIYLVNNYEESEDSKDITNITYSSDLEEQVYADLCFVYNELNLYEKAVETKRKIKSNEVIYQTIPFFTRIFIEKKDYKALIEFYIEQIKNKSKNNTNHLIINLEDQLRINPIKEAKYLYDFFSKEETAYGILNKIRIRQDSDLLRKIKELDFSTLPDFYGDIIYYLIRKNINIKEYICDLRENKWEGYFNYLINKYGEEFIKISTDEILKLEKNPNKINKKYYKVLSKMILSYGNLNDKDYEVIFNYYLDFGIQDILRIYKDDIIENELVQDIKTDEDLFLFYLMCAKNNIYDLKIYANYLKKALNTYPAMIKGIEILKKEAEEDKDIEIDQTIPISLCMIVKDEEDLLSNCVESAKDYVDEIIIVDTGSTDKTKAIAKKYTDKIFDFTWCDDFAKARNFSISKASNDWILVLDADEEIINFNKRSIYNFIKLKTDFVGRIKIINKFNDGNEIKIQIERVNRLFNKKYYEYEGIVHEQITRKDELELKARPVDIEAQHLGYLDEIVILRNKLERNIKLLLVAIKENPKDPYLYYQLGKSYYKNKELLKAKDSFEEAINLLIDFKFEYTQDLIISYGYTLINLEEYSKALNLDEYKSYFDKSPDFNFLFGLIYMNNALFEKAIESFKKCVGASEGKIEGINSYQSNYNIGVIYEMLGFKIEALQYYVLAKDFNQAKERKDIIFVKIKNQITRLIEDGLLEDGKKILERILSFYKNAELYNIKGVISMIEANFDEALICFNEGLKLDENNEDILYNLEYLKNQIKE